MNENGNEYVSLVRIPRKWFFVFVVVFSGLIIANTVAEYCFGWVWKDLGETTLARTAVLMTLIVGWFFILSHILEAIMLGYAKLFKNRILAEGEAKAEDKLYKKLEQAQKEGKTLEEVLEARNAEKNGKVNQHSDSKAA